MATEADAGWFDNSLRVLVASNLVTMMIALVEGWSLAPVLFIYWAQSMVIGTFHVRRLLDLEEFTTAGLEMNGHPMTPGPKAQRQIAGFFAVHYGFFHLAYLVFVLTIIDAGGGLPSGAWWALVGGVVVFAVNHFFSYLHNQESDRQGKPNIGTMLFLPYARILPMHLLMILGATIGGDTRFALMLFVLLKTIADAIMHVVEHRQLRRAPTAP